MRKISWLIVCLTAWGCGGDENCHFSEHVGAFGGDADGQIVLVPERVDDDNLVHVELSSEDDVFATGTVVVTEAVEGTCSDWTFEGELTDDLGGTGTIDGVLTTTTGEGTWTLDGQAGNWTWGTR